MSDTLTASNGIKMFQPAHDRSKKNTSTGCVSAFAISSFGNQSTSRSFFRVRTPASRSHNQIARERKRSMLYKTSFLKKGTKIKPLCCCCCCVCKLIFAIATAPSSGDFSARVVISFAAAVCNRPSLYKISSMVSDKIQRANTAAAQCDRYYNRERATSRRRRRRALLLRKREKSANKRQKYLAKRSRECVHSLSRRGPHLHIIS
jgi:hypothetical protein